MHKRLLLTLFLTLLSFPMLAQSTAKTRYQQGHNDELIITLATGETVITNIFSAQETGAEFSVLTKFNGQDAVYYSSRMDELYFTFSQTNPKRIDCVYASLHTQINVPVRKFRCGLNETISPKLFEQHRDDFAHTLPTLASDPNIAAQVNSKGKVIIPISQGNGFEVQAVYTTQNLADGQPDLFIIQHGESTKISAEAFYVEYLGKAKNLKANRLFKSVSKENTEFAPFTK